MKKALLGRRLFASLMPAAPAIVGEVGRGVAETVTNQFVAEKAPGISIGFTKISKTIPDPPASYEKYLDAEHALSKVRDFRYQRNRIMSDRYMMDPNIMCLKSVAPQHKAIMHLLQREREYEQNRTFLEQLKDALGLREFFNSRQGTEPYPEPASSSGYL